LISATLHEPEILFLDEPTAGVDPVSRRAFWLMIHRIAAEGTTVLLTTHYMDEAERCHRLALIFRGGVYALGTPAQILEKSGLAVVELDFGDAAQASAASAVLEGSPLLDEVAPFGRHAAGRDEDPRRHGAGRKLLATARMARACGRVKSRWRMPRLLGPLEAPVMAPASGAVAWKELVLPARPPHLRHGAGHPDHQLLLFGNDQQRRAPGAHDVRGSDHSEASRELVRA
jgi:hypothetical protein